MSDSTTSLSPLEFKGRMMSMSVLRVGSRDLELVAEALDKQLQKARGLLGEMPIVLEFAIPEIAVDKLLDVFAERRLPVVAAFRTHASLEAAIRHAGLPVIREQGGTRPPRADPVEADSAPVESEAAVAAEPQEPAPAGAARQRIVTTPVRSGQRLYARGGDLIVMAAVGAGAEVIADGCVHIYGSLRGRAIAGAQGDESARIFCRDLQAEILAVAGRYKVADDIPDAMRGQAVQVRLDGERLCIDSL